MANEQSVIDQIKAMEAWAIQAKKLADSQKYDEAVKLLKNINTQGRRLEWKGGSRGLRQLPEMEESKRLQLKISQARSAAQNSISAAQHVSKLGKKKGKTPADVAAIKSKGSSYLKDVGKNLSICIQVLKEANTLVSSQFWMNKDVLMRKENKNVLIMALRREGFYENVDPNYFKFLSLAGVDFRGADLRGAKLSEADLGGAYFYLANLKGASLKGANLVEANLRGANLTEANLSGANLTGVDLHGANLRGANLTRAYLPEVNLRGANLTEANLSGADLHGANLTKANLTVVDLRGAYLPGANLSEADLTQANLSGANLTGVDLTQANLSGANLPGADLTKANLSAADLTGANLEGANLFEANLANVSGLTRAQLRSVKNWERAKNIPKLYI